MQVFGSGDGAVSLALFCKVVDNFGDIGICWRLARQLTHEHGVAVTLWVDDLASFKRIMPMVQTGRILQLAEGVVVRHWQGDPESVSASEIADIVIEFFGCDIPETYIAAMIYRNPKPVWLNLEGLTAEKWVEGCHKLPSPHPRLPLTKWFFFPGFNKKTGGLLRETALEAQRRQFLADPEAVSDFLVALGMAPAEAAGVKVSLFCYPHAPVTALFSAMAAGRVPVTCFVPEGVASAAVAAFLRTHPVPGVVRSEGALTVRVIPFLPQSDYDKLLWACDVNFVRGEDSFVRAQWAGRPFLWHIYPQDENLHHVKLRAFLDISALGSAATTATLLWNDALPGTHAPDAVAWLGIWDEFERALPCSASLSAAWRDCLLRQDDLSARLLDFAASRRAASPENQL